MAAAKQLFFAEIIESSLFQWKAQCWQWNHMPEFGSLIAIETPKRTVLGIVYEVNTGSLDPHRTPFAYQKTEEELSLEQPHIFEFLRTTFLCAPVGYIEHEKIIYQLPPTPPSIHTFVAQATGQQVRLALQSAQYLPLLFAAPLGTMVDELLLALLRLSQKNSLLTSEHLHEYIDTYTLLSNNDYRRLKLFVQRLQ